MSQFTGEIHPYADMFPMLPDDDLDALAADIKANGQRHPILLTFDGILVDGRNRLEACKRAKVEPQFRTIDADPVAYIISANMQRRDLTQGQKAHLAVAAGDYSLISTRQQAVIAGVSQAHIAQARVVAEYAPHLSQQVIEGAESHKDAYLIAKGVKDNAVIERRRIEELREQAPDILQIEDLSLSEKWAVYQERHAKRLEAEKERARDIKQTNDFISRSVLLLSHLGTSASKEHGPALPDFLTHWNAKDSNVPPDLLNQQLIDQAISALQRLKDEGWLA